LRDDLRGFPFESTTGVEGVLEIPEAKGERDSLGVELRRDGNRKRVFGGWWSFTGLEVGKGILETAGRVGGDTALVTRTGGGGRVVAGIGGVRGGDTSNGSW
jgi:hypothetical protein